MVEDGSTSIFCYIVQSALDRKKGFSYYMMYKVSACMRNMLCINSNQKPMVSAGCIDTLMSISAEAEKNSRIADIVTQPCLDNCAAALRSLTYVDM